MSNIIKPEQVKMARAALNWGVKDLADKAGVGINTITRFEKGGNVMIDTLQKMIDALSKHVEFIPENGGGVGVRLKNNSEN